MSGTTIIKAENVERKSLPGRILVVDDVASNRFILQRRLSRLGHSVQCAEGGHQALEMLSMADYDLVLLDMLMPDMHGDEVLFCIKSDVLLKHIPVIVISALDEMKSVIKCIEAGAEDYLSKPVDTTLLKARINSVLEKKKLRDETAALVRRLESELEDAKRAQLNMVPHDFPDATLLQPISVRGYMRPAREVGGDFYDFFYTGENNLWFLVGDVSDKGVASGMFMARTVALIRSIPSQYYNFSGQLMMPHEVLCRLNIELCEFNPEMTFVTLILARINTQTGKMHIGNAGHAAPYSLFPSSVTQLVDTKRGRPLGIRTDTSYQTHDGELKAGQSLFLYTDGITDALDINEQAFGEDKMKACLNESSELTSALPIENMKKAISEHVGNAVQFDDITMLLVTWDGYDEKFVNNFTLTNSIGEITKISDQMSNLYQVNNIAEGVASDLRLVVEEVLNNIIEHGFDDDAISHPISVKLVHRDKIVCLEFKDGGTPFNPLLQDKPDLNVSLDDRGIGGLGIHFFLSLVDESSYEYSDSQNCLTLRKYL